MIENLIEAYLPMAKFLNVNDEWKSPLQAVKRSESMLTTPSTISRIPSKKNGNKSTPASTCEANTGPSIRRSLKKESFNESLDSSMVGTGSMSKINKRNQKGETPLHVVSQSLFMIISLITINQITLNFFVLRLVLSRTLRKSKNFSFLVLIQTHKTMLVGHHW